VDCGEASGIKDVELPRLGPTVHACRCFCGGADPTAIVYIFNDKFFQPHRLLVGEQHKVIFLEGMSEGAKK
jgi:hypothetical protein